jgi:type IV fimbrial biogenesis protein FimT
MVKKNSGFTLLELMITIAIFVILTAIAIPNFINWLPKYKLATATDKLFVLMQQARLRAIRDNANVVVNFDGNGNCTAFVDSGVTGDAGAPFDTALRGNGSQDGVEPTIGSFSIPAGITPVDINFSGDQRLVFTSRGMTNSDFGHVYLTNGRDGYKGLTITRSGSIRTSGSSDGVSWD